MAVLPRRTRLILLIFGGLLPVVCYGAVRVALRINLRNVRESIGLAGDSARALEDLDPDLLGEKGQLDRKRVDTLLQEAQDCLSARHVTTSAPGGRDPFKQPGKEAAVVAAASTPAVEERETVRLPKMMLGGILRNEAGAVALIDGRVVREGDSVGQGVVVAAIGSQSVTVAVSRGGKEFTTELVLHPR